MQWNFVARDNRKPIRTPYLTTTDPGPLTRSGEDLGPTGANLHLRELTPGGEARVLRESERNHAAESIDLVCACADERGILRGMVVEHYREIEIALARRKGDGARMTVSNIHRVDARHARQTAADKPGPELAGLSVEGAEGGQSRAADNSTANPKPPWIHRSGLRLAVSQRFFEGSRRAKESIAKLMRRLDVGILVELVEGGDHDQVRSWLKV